jgi:hypothetical protein
MLNVAEKVTDGKSRTTEDDVTTIRRTEMLRHFPICARQFDRQGNLMDQNPQALHIFGSPASQNTKNKNTTTTTDEEAASDTGSTTTTTAASTTMSKSTDDTGEDTPDLTTTDHTSSSSTTTTTTATASNNHQAESSENEDNAVGVGGEERGNSIDSSTRSTTTTSHHQDDDGGADVGSTTASTTTDGGGILNDFLAQFVDLDEGKQVLEEVWEGHDYGTEIQQRTVDGPKWFTLNVRQIQDPVTSEPVIIYSARDITSIMKSAKEETDRQNMKKNEFCKCRNAIFLGFVSIKLVENREMYIFTKFEILTTITTAFSR